VLDPSNQFLGSRLRAALLRQFSQVSEPTVIVSETTVISRQPSKITSHASVERFLRLQLALNRLGDVVGLLQ
jgi:hypothetical protein